MKINEIGKANQSDLIAIEEAASAILRDSNAKASNSNGPSSCRAIRLKDGETFGFGLRTASGERFIFLADRTQLDALSGKRDVFGFDQSKAEIGDGALEILFGGERIHYERYSERNGLFVTEKEENALNEENKRCAFSQLRESQLNSKIFFLRKLAKSAKAIAASVDFPDGEGKYAHASIDGIDVSFLRRKAFRGKSSSLLCFAQSLTSGENARLSLRACNVAELAKGIEGKCHKGAEDAKTALNQIAGYEISKKNLMGLIGEINPSREAVGTSFDPMSCSDKAFGYVDKNGWFVK
jgi:hypothetical protein